MTIERLIESVVRCYKCGLPPPARYGENYGLCQCYEVCSCGCYVDRGEICPNPKTRRCSLKVIRGVYDRKSKSWIKKISAIKSNEGSE